MFTLEELKKAEDSCFYAGTIKERIRILTKLIELDVSVNVIDALFDEPEIRKKGFTTDFVREEKANYWQEQMKEIQ